MQTQITTKTRSLKLYKPHQGQIQMHQSKKKYRIGVWGRQSGKSTYGNNELAKRTWTMGVGIHWFMAHVHSAADIQYRRQRYSLVRSNCVRRKSDTDLELNLKNGGSMFYKSGKILEDLRSETLKSAIIDELRNQHPNLWPLIIYPMLSTTNGPCDFISTPNGYDALFELVDFARQPQNKDDWDIFINPSTINPLFTLEAYESARRTMTDKQFRQEILAEFLDLNAGKAYYAFSDQNVKDTSPFASQGSPLISKHLPIILGCDFNVNPMSWVLGQNRGRRWYWFDEIRLEQSNTPEASEELIRKLTDLRDKGLLSRQTQVIICGDSTGKNTSTKVKAGESDYDIMKAALEKHGFTYEDMTPEANPFVKDRVNAVNAVCKSADGSVEMWIHSQCKWLIRDLRMVVWKEGSGILDQKKDTTLTHMSDAIGYPIHKLTPVPDIGNEVGELRVIY